MPSCYLEQKWWLSWKADNGKFALEICQREGQITGRLRHRMHSDLLFARFENSGPFLMPHNQAVIMAL